MTIEDLLVQQGESWRASQSAAPSMSAVLDAVADDQVRLEIPAERSSRRSRGWLPALVAAVVLALVAGTFALVNRGDSDRTPPATHPVVPAVVVPWSDLPASDPVKVPNVFHDMPTESQQATSNPQSPYPNCTSDELRGTPTHVTGNNWVVTVTTTERTCSVSPYPPDVFTNDAAGHTLSLGSFNLLVLIPGWTPISPRDLYEVPVTLCGATTTSIRLTFDATIRTAGNPASIDVPVSGVGDCAGNSVGRGPSAAAGAVSSLIRSYDTPVAVTPGQTMNYSVTLTNPADVPVSLKSCPDFTQALVDPLKTNRTTATPADQLNCAGAPEQIAAHTSVEFQMRLAVPKNLPAGNYRLVWNWYGIYDDGNGYVDFAQVTVR